MDYKNSIEKTEYVQSANSLFHFMKEERYLMNALKKCALIPRYCKENIEYMHLKRPDGSIIKEMLVLQKCFCDIPFHKIKTQFPINIVNESQLPVLSRDKLPEHRFNTHVGCYGEFGIAFSKEWCVNQGLQPIIYLNPEADYLFQLKKLFNQLLLEETPNEYCISHLLQQFSYIKPLEGILSRSISGVAVDFKKNFHDEKEWRYIPDDKTLSEKQLDKITFRRAAIDYYLDINSSIEAPTYNMLWLKFTYNDIKYIIVPTHLYRERLVAFILELPAELFSSEVGRGVLISKIQVLEDIEKDW